MSEMIATELIVLHTTKVGDNSLVIHALSKDYGRRSFLVRGAGKKAMALFLPLNILEAEIIESSKSTLYTAKNLVSACPLTGIRNSVVKNTMTMFMSEVIYRVVKEGASEQGLYEWAKKNIVLLDALETDFSNFHIRFLLELTVVLGFSPESETMRHFAAERYQMLIDFMKTPFAESMLMPMNGTLRNELSECIIRYIEYHTESTININSLKVLREVFA